MPDPMRSQLAPGRPIPTPPSFPVRWQHPAQARQLWALDRQHFRGPLPPLAADVWCRQCLSGTNRAMEYYQLPVRLEMLAINGYLYNCYQPVALPPAAVLKGLNTVNRFAPKLFQAVRRNVAAGMEARYMPKIGPIIGSLQARWDHEWLPEMREHLAFWHTFNLRGSSEEALAAHLSESLRRIERLWELHFLIVIPAFIAMSQFEDLHRQLFEADRSGDIMTTQRLVQTAETSFLQADRALWRLSRQARSLPAVRETLERVPASQVVPALAGSAEGQIFLAELHAWLNRYGLRGHAGDGLSDTSWLDDPRPAVQHLQAFLQQPDNDLEAELQVQAAECAAAVEQVRQRLLAQPSHVRDQYASALAGAQSANFLSTEHHFWIDQQAMFCLRRVFLELGCRRAEAGALDQAEDIFFQTLDEVLAPGTNSSPSSPRELVAARKAQLGQARALSPPAFLGALPLMLPPPEDPFVRAMTRVLGADALAPTGRLPPPTPRELSGQAASPGVARGPVRILRGMHESARLQPGDILVAEATMPVWTPLFAIAAGVVTDVGGILSHAATTAREYGIPAIVGAGNASTVLHDDQLVEINGQTGIVRLIEGTGS